jgi:hypothetical protein
MNDQQYLAVYLDKAKKQTYIPLLFGLNRHDVVTIDIHSSAQLRAVMQRREYKLAEQFGRQVLANSAASGQRQLAGSGNGLVAVTEAIVTAAANNILEVNRAEHKRQHKGLGTLGNIGGTLYFGGLIVLGMIGGPLAPLAIQAIAAGAAVFFAGATYSILWVDPRTRKPQEAITEANEILKETAIHPFLGAERLLVFAARNRN